MSWEQPELPFPPIEGIRVHLVQMTEDIEGLHDHVPEKAALPCGCAGTGDVAELARTILAARALVGAVRDLEHTVEQLLVATMPSRQMVADGLVLERKSGSLRKRWDHPAVASKLAARACIDEETGEVLGDSSFAQRVTDEILAVGHVDYWRAGELRSRGIDPDRYAETERGQPTVVIRTPA